MSKNLFNKIGWSVCVMSLAALSMSGCGGTSVKVQKDATVLNRVSEETASSMSEVVTETDSESQPETLQDVAIPEDTTETYVPESEIPMQTESVVEDVSVVTIPYASQEEEEYYKTHRIDIVWEDRIPTDVQYRFGKDTPELYRLVEDWVFEVKDYFIDGPIEVYMLDLYTEDGSADSICVYIPMTRELNSFTIYLTEDLLLWDKRSDLIGYSPYGMQGTQNDSPIVFEYASEVDYCDLLDFDVFGTGLNGEEYGCENAVKKLIKENLGWSGNVIVAHSGWSYQNDSITNEYRNIEIYKLTTYEGESTEIYITSDGIITFATAEEKARIKDIAFDKEAYLDKLSKRNEYAKNNNIYGE